MGQLQSNNGNVLDLHLQVYKKTNKQTHKQKLPKTTQPFCFWLGGTNEFIGITYRGGSCRAKKSPG